MADTAAGLSEQAAVLVVVAFLGVVLLFVAKGWQFPGRRGLIKFKSGRHGRRIGYALILLVSGLGALWHFASRLTGEAGQAWPGVLVGVASLASGAGLLTWSGSWRVRRYVWTGAGMLVALILIGSVAGPVLEAIGSAAHDTGDAVGRGGAATARAVPYVLGFLALAAVAGLLCYWMVDRAASREQMFNRAGLCLAGVVVLIVVLLVTGLIAPSDLAPDGGER